MCIIYNRICSILLNNWINYIDTNIGIETFDRNFAEVDFREKIRRDRSNGIPSIVARRRRRRQARSDGKRADSFMAGHRSRDSKGRWATNANRRPAVWKRKSSGDRDDSLFEARSPDVPSFSGIPRYTPLPDASRRQRLLQAPWCVQTSWRKLRQRRNFRAAPRDGSLFCWWTRKFGEVWTISREKKRSWRRSSWQVTRFERLFYIYIYIEEIVVCEHRKFLVSLFRIGALYNLWISSIFESFQLILKASMLL